MFADRWERRRRSLIFFYGIEGYPCMCVCVCFCIYMYTHIHDDEFARFYVHKSCMDIIKGRTRTVAAEDQWFAFYPFVRSRSALWRSTKPEFPSKHWSVWPNRHDAVSVSESTPGYGWSPDSRNRTLFDRYNAVL